MKRHDRKALDTQAPEAGTTGISGMEAGARKKERRDSFLSNGLLYLAAILLFWSLGYTQMRGSDLWWHTASGRLICDQGSIPRVDPWSFPRDDRPWMHHEWLADVVYHFWTEALGMESLVWWKWAVVVLTFLILMRTLHRLARDPTAAFLAALAAAVVAAPFLDIRPHLYSLLGTVLVLRLCLGPKRPPWFLPLLFLVWVNLHGGFFFGLMTLWIIVAASFLFPPAEAAVSGTGSGTGRYRLYLVLLGLACTLICLVNPNGLEPFAYPLRYAFSTTSVYRTLGEWWPPFQAGGIRSPLYPAGIGLFAAGVLCVFLSGRWRESRRGSLAGLALGLLTLAMSLKSRRFIPLFAICGSLLTAPALGFVLSASVRALKRLMKKRPWPRPVRFLLPGAALLLGILRLAPYPHSGDAFLHLTAGDTFPVETCNFIEANRIRGNVFAYYNWGGYLHLRTQGGMKVYIDGRADTIFDDETYLRYVRVLSNLPGSVEIVEDSGADWVLWPGHKAELVRDLVRTGRWKPVFQDAVSFLLVRKDLPLPLPFSDTPDSAFREVRLADHAFAQGDLAGAEEYLRGALRRMPTLDLACYRLARVQALQGRVPEARNTAGQCRRLFPGSWRDKTFETWLEKQTAGR